MKRIFAKIISISLLVCLLVPALASCESEEPQEVQLNIIDDNYRNWYEIYVGSFYDTNNDGIGDLAGVTAKLDYIKEMGFNGIWLMPIHPSPTYHKYDVNDYYKIDPDYGTLEDLDTLISEAHSRGIRVILDLVVNHTSTENTWFKEACQYIRENGKPGGEYGDFYNFRQGTASNYHQVSGTPYYYEGQFWSGMPDLNLDSQNVRAAIADVMEYWLVDHDVDGFRLDAVTSYYTGSVPKNVDFLSWINTTAKSFKSDAYIVGEAWVSSDYTINQYYQSGCDSFFLFTGAQATGSIANIVKQANGKALGNLMVKLQETYTSGILAPFLGNHDTMRPGSFMPGVERVKMAGGILATMNGGCYVYYGEEIGMISKGGNNSDPAKRIAMKWQAKNIYEGHCFVSPENVPVDKTSYLYPSVAEQEADKSSILNYYKRAMQLRNMFPAIARGEVENFSPADNSYICVITKTYKDEKITIVYNLDEWEQTITLDETLGCTEIVGDLYASGDAKAEYKDGKLVLPPYSIAILK